MRKFAFAALCLAATIATPALAQDNPNLGGFHIDGLVGWLIVGLSFLFWGWFERRQLRVRANRARGFLGQGLPA